MDNCGSLPLEFLSKTRVYIAVTSSAFQSENNVFYITAKIFLIIEDMPKYGIVEDACTYCWKKNFHSKLTYIII
jgi:hypothetical protein